MIGVLVIGSPAGSAKGGFSTPLQLRGSYGFGQPSLAIGSGRIVITAPNCLLTTATSDQPCPVSISTDGGVSFNGPIFPTDAGVVGEPAGGGDTDLALDAASDIFQTDLWLVDSTTRVSTDGGQTWLSDIFSHTSPGDDRPASRSASPSARTTVRRGASP